MKPAALGLDEISHEGAQFTPPDVPRFTQTSDLTTTREPGEEVAGTMNGRLACYLVNHGIVVANTIDQAVVSAINLERASQVQLLAAAYGQPFRWTSFEAINQGHLDDFLALFAPDDTVADVSTYSGHEAIRAWAQRETFNVQVRFHVIREKNEEGTIVEGNVQSVGLKAVAAVNAR